MEHAREFYIGGKWVPPHGDETLAVINPATEQEIDSIAMGGSVDVDAAVAAARSAFEDTRPRPATSGSRCSTA